MRIFSKELRFRENYLTRPVKLFSGVVEMRTNCGPDTPSIDLPGRRFNYVTHALIIDVQRDAVEISFTRNDVHDQWLA